MEHRLWTRRPVSIDAAVDDRSAQRRSGRIRDVSLGGVFIELPSEGIAPNTSIRLRFTSPAGRACQWQGVVTRVAQDGIGASFFSADPRDMEGQVALLRACDSRSVRR